MAKKTAPKIKTEIPTNKTYSIAACPVLGDIFLSLYLRGTSFRVYLNFMSITIHSKTLGFIAVDPETSQSNDLTQASMAIFPFPLKRDLSDIYADWAACSRTPIFCRKDDLTLFGDSGFGEYRFQILDGYKELNFEGGIIEFFPARKLRQKGIAFKVNHFLEKKLWISCFCSSSRRRRHSSFCISGSR
jgi:hypothetical protein